MSNSWKDATKSSYKYEKDWWKAPVLQGPENDYGEYDYMIEDIPDNSSEWSFEKAKFKCDCCGRYRHLLKESYAYFRTIDGYDYQAWYECASCATLEKYRRIINRLKKRAKWWRETVSTAWQFYIASKKMIKFKECYKKVKEWKKT